VCNLLLPFKKRQDDVIPFAEGGELLVPGGLRWDKPAQLFEIEGFQNGWFKMTP